MIIFTPVGLFGPYGRVQELEDRLRTWPVGAPDGALGADIPFSVIGTAEVFDIETPAGFSADAFTWNGSELVPNAPSAPAPE